MLNIEHLIYEFSIINTQYSIFKFRNTNMLTYSTIIFTTISFIKEAPEVPVSPTPTPFKLY